MKSLQAENKNMANIPTYPVFSQLISLHFTSKALYVSI